MSQFWDSNAKKVANQIKKSETGGLKTEEELSASLRFIIN